MSRTAAVIGSTIFFFLAPGVLAFLLPWLLAEYAVEPMWRDIPAINWIALAIGAVGLVALIECFARFALKGRGTPAPIAPPQHLVVTGLYRHVRNPMYVAVVTIILAHAFWFASWPILAYAAIVWLAFTAFVMGYEEPRLAADHGEAYAAYSANVGRWLPRLTPCSPEV